MRAPELLPRFSRAVRVVHWSAGLLTLVCLATAAVLYNSSLAVLVGRRHLVEQVHIYCGYALVAPLLLGLLARSYRADLGRLNRFTPDDWRWLRSPTRRDGTLPVGKFNAGQKLNAALSGGGLAALLLTGTVMHQTGWTSLSARTGATFVHDWAAVCLGLLVIGHLSYALRDTAAMQGMRSGLVPLGWARREHGAWAAEEADPAVVAEPTELRR